MTSEFHASELDHIRFEDGDDRAYWPEYRRIIVPAGEARIVCRDGTIAYFLDGRPHREDGPAIEAPNGCRTWMVNGKVHRGDGPAIEWRDGRRQWVLNGKTTKYRSPAYPQHDIG